MKRMHRLVEARDFARLFRTGKRKDFGAFRVVARRNSLSYARFAFILSQKTDKRAVVRNRIRRRSREWFRKEKTPLDLPADAALIFSKSAAALSRKELYALLSDANRFIRNISLSSRRIA